MTKAITPITIHPLSWWLAGLGLAVVAGASGSMATQLVVIAIAVVTVLLFRQDAPWSRSIGFYLLLASVVVLARIAFRILFNPALSEGPIALSLPAFSLDLGIGPQITLLGPISYAALTDGLGNGLKLAAIILAVGMASSLANPRQLLRSTPSALYEIASSVSVAINLAPQLITSLQRVRRARSLRGRSKGLGAMAGTVIPVLEDAIDSSLALAASMDARGFGRRGAMTKLQLNLSRASSLAAIALLTIGSFLMLIGANWALPVVLMTVGLGASALSMRIAAKAHIRTQHRKLQFALADYALFGISALASGAALAGWLG